MRSLLLKPNILGALMVHLSVNFWHLVLLKLYFCIAEPAGPHCVYLFLACIYVFETLEVSFMFLKGGRFT